MTLNIFRHKSSEAKPDLIIPVYEPALDFVLRHGEDLFPGVPIVFCGIPEQFVEKLSMGPNITGYLRENNYADTLEPALSLHPNAKHVVVFAGADPVGTSKPAQTKWGQLNYKRRGGDV